jgi:caspase domain-containing protein
MIMPLARRWIAWGGPVVLTILLGIRAGYAAPADARPAAPAAQADRRLALVIGNNAYAETPLRNAVPDATAIASALKDAGFAVTVLTDVTFPRFERAVLDFSSQLQPTDVALFYFSGHGVEVDKENYLIPVDFAGAEADVKYKAYSASRVYEHLARARVRFIILDACRNNPFGSTRRLRRGGLASMDDMSTTGTMIAFATGPGATADDNAPGKNGLFTTHLLAALTEPGVPAHELFRRVRARVTAASGGKQQPWLSENLNGDFYFRAGAAGSPSADTESAVWNAIKDSQNPAIFEQFLRDYPAGRLRLAAQAKLDALRGPANSPGAEASSLRIINVVSRSDNDDAALRPAFEQHTAPLRAAGFALSFDPRPPRFDRRWFALDLKKSVAPTSVNGVQMTSCRVSFDFGEGKSDPFVTFAESGVAPTETAACSEALSKAVRSAVTAMVQAMRRG